MRGIISHNINVVGLVTRPSGNRGNVCDYVDLHPLCHEHDITVIDTLDINSEETLARVKALDPDYIFTLGTSQLFKQEFLSLAKQWVIGSHPSPLPKGRGRAPVPWTILQAHRESAVSFFKMELGADTGDLLQRNRFSIPERAYANEVYQLVAHNLRDGFCQLHDKIVSGTIEFLPQDAEQATYRARRGPADGFVDFAAGASQIDRLIRAVSHPYPGAYVYYEDTKFEVWEAHPNNAPQIMGTTGQILAVADDQVLVQASDKPLWLSSFTQSGTAIPASTFRVGQHFNYRLHDEVFAIKEAIRALQKRLD
ncbi:MAG: methionyl-tRNA formyltransferase [Pseudomonadota bacterium]